MITMIAAVARNGVIGMGNTIPWHLPEDFKHFKATTNESIVLMGSRTWDSLPRKPLPNRRNIVVSRDEFRVETENEMNERDNLAVVWYTNLRVALADCRSLATATGMEIFIIGGSALYEQMMPLADRLLISHVDLEPEGDTFFPEIGSEWTVLNEDIRPGFTIRDYCKLPLT